MSELARLTDPEMFAVVAQTVAFRYYGKLKSESEDALARAVALANKVASIRAVYGTAEIFPALVSCAIAKLSASTQSFPTSSRHSRQAGVAGTESSIDAEHFGATCSRDDLLDVLGLVFEAMTAGASELTNENTRALARCTKRVTLGSRT